ncbi:hypothetical protein [Roseobacter ponti]|uniref:Uncharacterized protein n=1 Tax=Roseobacter ponti TaxID=1891787 RepID=A0A858SVX9_9RHOB|nr:hypothetical protein [Roseobacter ponti]QJF51982.1 hypothetical protein G3256_12815 [Roseobacter ponti]
MNPMNIRLEDFPSLDPSKATKWAPIVCRPKEASLEKFIVGIVAVDKDGYHIEVANQLSRLGCLYGDNAMPIALSIEIAVAWLEEVFADGDTSLLDLRFPVTNIFLGKCESAIGVEREEVAQEWMATLSSFYEKPENAVYSSAQSVVANAKEELQAQKLRLPVRVLTVIERQEPSLLEYFHEDVRNKSFRRLRANARIKIDYNGRKLSANIDDFNVDAPARTVGVLKQRMWDLSIQRERVAQSSKAINDFEMLVDFPQYRIADKQPSSIARIQEHVRELTEQADSEQIRLRTMSGPNQIGEHILHKESV